MSDKINTPLLAVCIALTITLAAFVVWPQTFLALVSTKDVDRTCLTKDAAVYIAGCALVVAIVQAAFFVRQLGLMGQTIKTANQTFQLSARTWVFAGPQNIDEIDGRIGFTMWAVNYGKTPANVAELVLGFAVDVPAGPANYDGCDRLNASSFPLGPDRDSFAFDPPFYPDFDVPVVYGYVVYFDSVQRRHESRFCYRLVEYDGQWEAASAGGPDWHRFD